MINSKTIAHIPQEVAPFAKRLINPENLGSSRVLNKIGETRKKLDLIKDENIKNCFNSLYEKIINETNNIENLSNGILELSQKIEMIENKATKELLLDEIKKLIQANKKDFRKDFSNKMEFIEIATDAVNIMNKKYMNVKSEPREFYEWLNKKNSWFADVIDGEIKPQNTYRNGYAQRKKATLDYNKYLENFSKTQKMRIPETFQNNLELETFRKLVDEYNFFNPDAIYKIYNNEYLNRHPQEIKEIFKRINDTYGTLVISSNAKLTVDDAKYIEEELKLWKEAGNDRAILPNVINIDFLNKQLNQTNADGNALNFSRKINLKDLLDLDASNRYSSSTIRHEINHLNDRNIKAENDFERFFNYIHWQINKILHKKEWKNELQNAGINDFYQNYALKNKYELKSVTSESDFDRLTNKFKNQLIKKFKMENWIFNIKNNRILFDKKFEKICNSQN